MLFQFGKIKLASGRESHFKIECDALTEDDWTALAFLGSKIVRPFNRVIGVPTGGNIFAEAMEKYINPDAKLRLVVDDVWTTGGSMRQVMAPGDIGLVAFSRGHLDMNVSTIFRLNNFAVNF